MAKPYSADLRTRVADAIANGESSRAIADRFGLAPSTVIKWAKRLRETGSLAPAKFGGHLTCRLDPHRDFVLDRLPDVDQVVVAPRQPRTPRDQEERLLALDADMGAEDRAGVRGHGRNMHRRRTPER